MIQDTKKRVALVHDYLNDFGGAERVLKVLSEIYPDAPIYTIFTVKGSSAYKKFKDKKIVESWFAKIPFCHKLISPLRFLLPAIWNSFDLSEYDLVITSASWAVTKGLKRGKVTKEICYLHTPPRWLYGYDESRNWENKWYGTLVKGYALIVGHLLRQYDFRQAQKVDLFIVNSENVARRIEKFYRRKADHIIYPPVDVEKFKSLKNPYFKGKYYLTGGRMTSAKNFDLIIKVFNELKLHLKIYGSGILEKELRGMANKNVEFVGKVNDQELVELYQGARAFITAQKDEDFGITPVEAMAAGTPVIAYFGGGYKETVVEDKTGIFFEALSVESLKRAVQSFETSGYKKIRSADCIKQAEKFSKDNFVKQFKRVVEDVM
ncbi:glycosyltransferase [Candidatus Woesebacteria bacterium]|nr:glycosyltransferase [Candidatus Woesebacteria bacterium]